MRPRNSLKPNPRLMLRQTSTTLMLFFFFLMLSCAHALAQTQGREASGATASPAPVRLNLIVTDESGHAVEDLKREDVKILEDGQPQALTLFEKETLPVSYALVIDNSGSLRSQMAEVIEASKNIIKANQAGDTTAIVRFVDAPQIELVQDFTSDQSALLFALTQMRPEAGQTALIDALYFSAQKLAQSAQAANASHRALILVSDGEDRESQYKKETLFEKLREVNAQVFVIGWVQALDTGSGFINKSARERSVQFLERLTKETGGRVFYPRKREDLPQIAAEISRDLHTQFVIGYNPAPSAKGKTARKVEIKISDTPAAGGKRKAISHPIYPATNK